MYSIQFNFECRGYYENRGIQQIRRIKIFNLSLIDDLYFYFSVTSNPDKFGVPSAPHSLSISSHSANYLTVTWQPPEFSLPSERLKYR